MNWMISADGKIYDHAAAFAKWGFIDWRQRVTYQIGDVVYIYCKRPIKKVMYKAVVENESMTSQDIVDDSMFWGDREEYDKALEGKYARLRLIKRFDSELLTLEHLQENGLKRAPQGPIRISEELAAYIDGVIDGQNGADLYPECDVPEDCYEGAKQEVIVNKYERNPLARKKCIEYHGKQCLVCGFDFEAMYGALGAGFIHIHHVIPLSEICEEYKVDYENDLIPVCPNCHAMLHRKIDGKLVDWRELREYLQGKKKQ